MQVSSIAFQCQNLPTAEVGELGRSSRRFQPIDRPIEVDARCVNFDRAVGFGAREQKIIAVRTLNPNHILIGEVESFSVVAAAVGANSHGEIGDWGWWLVSIAGFRAVFRSSTGNYGRKYEVGQMAIERIEINGGILQAIVAGIAPDILIHRS